jgi:hypothetical protein
MNNPTFFSFGFRCSSAAILKKLGLKHESYPFDWLISDLSVIQKCFSDDFKEFLNVKNYKRKFSNTYEMAESTQGFICDEHLMVNMAYQPEDEQDVENTYQYKLAMNHHNILEKKDHDYYTRCVQRMRDIFQSNTPKIYVHITRLISKERYVREQINLLKQLREFDDFIVPLSKSSLKGLIFILVKNPNEEHHNVRELLYESETTKTKIFILFTNSQFIDAGEEFMVNYHNESEFIQNKILGSLKE